MLWLLSPTVSTKWNCFQNQIYKKVKANKVSDRVFLLHYANINKVVYVNVSFLKHLQLPSSGNTWKGQVFVTTWFGTFHLMVYAGLCRY